MLSFLDDSHMADVSKKVFNFIVTTKMAAVEMDTKKNLRYTLYDNPNFEWLAAFR